MERSLLGKPTYHIKWLETHAEIKKFVYLLQGWIYLYKCCVDWYKEKESAQAKSCLTPFISLFGKSFFSVY